MIGFIGGTGNQGRALALRIASGGNEVLLGSRSLEKAKKAVNKIKNERKGLKIRPVTNEEAAKDAEIVFVTLPYKTMKGVLTPLKKSLSGKIIVDVTNPLTNNNIHKGISASEELQAILKDSKIVCAFKNVSSVLLWSVKEKVKVDSIVCSDFLDAKERIIHLSEAIGIPSVDGGPLENALASELITRLLLHLNRVYNSETGFKFVFNKG